MLKTFTSFVVATTILGLHVSDASAFWRLLCDGNVALARIDPLTNIGSVSDHVHSIKGGSAFSSTAHSADLDKSNCSSCNVKEDNSAYWAPALYFQHDDGTVEVVPEKPPHKTYYFLNTGRTSDGKLQKIEAFPKGFQMIAGSNRNRESSIPDPDPNPLGPWADESQELRAQRALGFNCLNYARGSNEPSLHRHYLPDKSFLDANCADGIRLELMFPSCWNGKLDGGKDHKGHVAFPDGVMTGNCPEGFDRRLVSLFYETIVATDHFKDKSGKFVFSNGDTTGYGYHGDFMEAWAPGVLQDAIDQCTSPSGNMEDCPVFSYNSNPASCGLENPLPKEIISEDVTGPMAALPNGGKSSQGADRGNSGQGSSPGRGKGQEKSPKGQDYAAEVSPVVAKIPTVPVSDVQAPSPKAEPKEDKQVNQEAQEQYSTVSAVVSDSAPAPTPAPEGRPAERNAGKVIHTSIWTSGGQVHKDILVLEEVTVTASGGAVTQTQRARAHDRDYKDHGHKPHKRHQHHAAHGIGGRRMR